MSSKIVNHLSQSEDPLVKVAISCHKHRASWLALIYDEARKAGDGEKVKDYLFAATRRYGLKRGAALKAQLKSDPVDCTEFAKIFGEGTYRAEAMSAKLTHKSPERIDLEYYGCPLLAAWQEWGMDDETCQLLCRAAMNTDFAIAEGLGIHFDLKETLADGAPCCRCSYYR